MFCSKCGKELPDNAKFCGSCGTNVDDTWQASQATPATQPITQPANQNQASASASSPSPSASGKASAGASNFTQQATQAAPFTQSAQAAQSTQQATQAQKSSVDFKGEVSKLQGKLDNSNSTFLKGRSIWDIVGMCAVVLMIICFFLPAISATTILGTTTVSPASLMSLAGSSSYTSSFAGLMLIYLFPAVFCAVDLIITKENSSRHVRLIVLGLLNILLQSSISSIAEIINSAGGSLGVGFFLNIFASLVVIAIGIIGIYEKKKGNIVS